MKTVLAGDNVAFFCGGRKVFAHTPAEPFVTVLDGKVTYRSSHGSFSVRERIKKRTPLALSAESTEDRLVFECDGKRVEVTFAEMYGGVSLRLAANGDFAVELRFCATAGEGMFGGGEQYRQLDMKGHKTVNFVSEHIVVPPIIRKTLFGAFPYKEVPHEKIHTYSPFTTYVSSEKYALRFDVAAYGVADFTREDRSVFRFAECPAEVFCTSGESFRAVSESLAAHTPCNAYLPDWCFDGMIFALQGGIERVTEKALYLKENGVKVAGVWCQDWSGRKVTAVGKQVYWNWEADETMYPDLSGNISRLKAEGIRFLAYINPYLVKDGKLYNECAGKGMLIRNRKGEIYHVKSTTFDAGMLDLTNPAAVDFIKEILIKKNMLDIGIDGYMADFGEYLPVDCVLYDGDPKRLHNEWPVLWAKINREAVMSHPRAKEVFFFTRSGYNGVQAHTTVMWNGDQHVDFSADYGMPCVIPATFNLGFSGVTAVHSDVGGFISFASLVRDRELLTRWTEMSAFSPLIRSHETIRPDVNIQPYDAEMLPVTSSMARVHATLKPYLLHCMDEARKGIPVMRPDFYDSSDYADHTEDYAYLLGSDIFVAPVTKRGERTRRVTLPPGEWIRFFGGENVSGGKSAEFSAPLGVPVAFYRKDSPFADVFETVKL